MARAVHLPPELLEALESRLVGAAGPSIARATEDLSRRYRAAEAGAPVARTEADVLAYLAYRLPATYAAVAAALGAVRAADPSLEPRSLLDLGAGPGTASWAAAEAWPMLERVTAVEAVPRMAEAGRTLAAAAAHGALRSARWVEDDLARTAAFEPHDVVVLSYVLGELPAAAREDVLARAWAAAAACVVVVEPGTTTGYRTAVEARAVLLGRGGSTVAPCPHDAPCPMGGGDWCHFGVRLARSAGHRAAKRVALGWEDEKFSYAAVARARRPEGEARVLRRPQLRGGHVRLELCTAAGLRSEVVARREGPRYRQARKTEWGETFPVADAERAEPSELESGPPTAAA